MGIVFVNDWNGYRGGIYRTFENALESMAIGAVYKGIDGYAKHDADLESEIEQLVELGIGGSRLDRHLYSIMTHGNFEFFSINTHDIDVTPGYSPEITAVVSSDAKDPAWEIQRALFDFATNNFDEIEDLTEALFRRVDSKISDALNEADDVEAAFKTIMSSESPFADEIRKRLAPEGKVDAAGFLDSLPHNAIDLFKELATKAYPESFETEIPSP